tara:strand:+ start:778 stop:1308 length:531 start_codon:yes stop_codon:yes gene_type:complete
MTKRSDPVEWGKALKLARWRLHHVHQVPAQEIDDFLSDAVVLAFEQSVVDHPGLANWLSLVAFRRFIDHRRRLSTRKTQQFPASDFGESVPVEIDTPSKALQPDQIAERKERIDFDREKVRELLGSVTPKQEDALQLLVRLPQRQFISVAIGKTKQAAWQRVLAARAVWAGLYEDP